MTPYTDEQEEIRRYLLGQLSEEALQRIEERLLTEESFLEELVLAEEELADDYINGNLPDDDRLRFEQHFLSTPERHQNLRFAMALGRYTTTSPEKVGVESAESQSAVSPVDLTWVERFRTFWNGQSWALRAAASLVVIAILAGALWLTLFRASSPKTFAPLTLTINVDNNRAESTRARKVKLPLNADALKISLILPEPSPSGLRYRVELMNEEGETRPLEIDGQDARSISVVIPASQLERGQFALSLFATGANGSEQPVNGNYFFIVE